jgi:transcriptional regulator with XRE-family HTH domain
LSKEKQILQLLQRGYSQRRVADTLCVSRNTVAKVAKAHAEHPIACDAIEAMGEPELHRLLFPSEAALPALVAPDFAYIHK